MATTRLSNIEKDAAQGVFPRGRLEDLVRLVATDDAGLVIWDEYVAKTRFGFPNEGEFRLFSMIPSKLDSIEEMDRSVWIDEAARHASAAAVSNAVAKDAIAEIFTESSIQGRWTKGTALASTWYSNPKVRPSGDVDVICRFEDLLELSRALEKTGWTQKHGPKAFDQAAKYRGHGSTWTHEEGADVDITWLPRLTFAHDPWVLNYLFQDGAKVANADPTWLVIEALDHGLSANKVWPIRWVVDCLTLLEHPNCMLDWDLLLEVAERYKMALILFVGLKELRRFSENVPEHVLETLADLPISALHEQELRARLTLDNPRDNFVVSRRYNTFLRAPLRSYRAMVPSPLGREANQSLQLRAGIAGRNLLARFRYPIVL